VIYLCRFGCLNPVVPLYISLDIISIADGGSLYFPDMEILHILGVSP